MDGIRASGARAQLIVGDEQLDEQSTSSLEELLFVDAGWDVHANDELFAVLSFQLKIWVIPEFTQGANALLFAAWCEFLSNFQAVYRVRVDGVPRAWRARRFCIPTPQPRLGVHPKDTIPEWTAKTRMSFPEVPRIGSDR